MLHNPSQTSGYGVTVASLLEPARVAAWTEVLRQQMRPEDLARVARNANAWLWHGYLGPGKITLLTSQWKSGKTTLVSVLLARLAQGGELAGLPLTPGRAAVISEESADNWAARCRKLGIGSHVSFFCRPFKSKPSMAQWLGLMDAMLDLHRREGLDFVVVDPLTVFLPAHSENIAGVMTDCLLPLRDLTAEGLGVLLLHHPRKGVPLAGQAARGKKSGQRRSITSLLRRERMTRGYPNASNATMAPTAAIQALWTAREMCRSSSARSKGVRGERQSLRGPDGR
jgi:hypothetical protein